LGAKETRDIFGDGSFGGPYFTEPSIMDEIFQTALVDIINLLKFD